MNCAALPSGMNCKTYVKSPSPLAPSSAEHTSIIHSCTPEDKENVSMETKSWLSKVCNKLRSKHRRHEKCEKCGQRSDTCRPNASFISGRKHFLCQDCRVSSHNMKTMYHQLCRNLSLREHSRTTTCNSGDLSPPTSTRGGLSRSKSMKVQNTSPESGYETATSLDSSSSEQTSSDPMSTSSGECGRCSPHLHAGHTTCSPAPTRHHQGDCDASKDNPTCSRDRAEVFGGAFKSEKSHLRCLQQLMLQDRTCAQSPALPQQASPKAACPTPTKPHPKDTAATKQYDGYLEIRTPNSSSVKYVFQRPEGGEEEGQCQHHQVLKERKEGEKECYHCHKLHSVAFRAPFGHGWLCEDCMDDLM